MLNKASVAQKSQIDSNNAANVGNVVIWRVLLIQVDLTNQVGHLLEIVAVPFTLKQNK
jgi:hypothetical protein